VNHDYVNIDELLEDIAGNDGDGDCDEQGDGIGAEDAKIFENIGNRMDQDDILFGNPKWLENFKEMKQAAIDPLYKDCPKPWTVLRFNLCWHFLTSPLEVVSSQRRRHETPGTAAPQT
jgi:hypothetical protein